MRTKILLLTILLLAIGLLYAKSQQVELVKPNQEQYIIQHLLLFNENTGEFKWGTAYHYVLPEDFKRYEKDGWETISICPEITMDYSQFEGAEK